MDELEDNISFLSNSNKIYFFIIIATFIFTSLVTIDLSIAFYDKFDWAVGVTPLYKEYIDNSSNFFYINYLYLFYIMFICVAASLITVNYSNKNKIYKEINIIYKLFSSIKYFLIYNLLPFFIYIVSYFILSIVNTSIVEDVEYTTGLIVLRGTLVEFTTYPISSVIWILLFLHCLYYLYQFIKYLTSKK